MTRQPASLRMTGDVAVITAPASFDIYTAPEVRDLASRLLRDGTTRVVIDLAAVTYLDATALGVILTARRRLTAAGGRLAVAGASRLAARAFRVTGLARAITLYPAPGDAISAMLAGAGASLEDAARITAARQPPATGDDR